MPEFAKRMASAYQALEFLEQHRLDPTPVNYELALAYVTTPESDLTRETDAQIFGGLRLTAETATSLVRRYVRTDEENSRDQSARAMLIHAERLDALTTDAHHVTTELGRDLSAMVDESRQSPVEPGQLVGRLSFAEREIVSLRNDLAQLSSQIAASGNQNRAAALDSAEGVQTPASGSPSIHGTPADRPLIAATFVVDRLAALSGLHGKRVADNIFAALAATVQTEAPHELVFKSENQEIHLTSERLSLEDVRRIAENVLIEFAARRFRLRESGEWIGRVTASAAVSPGSTHTIQSVLETSRKAAHEESASGGDRIEGRAPLSS